MRLNMNFFFLFSGRFLDKISTIFQTFKINARKYLNICGFRFFSKCFAYVLSLILGELFCFFFFDQSIFELCFLLIIIIIIIKNRMVFVCVLYFVRNSRRYAENYPTESESESNLTEIPSEPSHSPSRFFLFSFVPFPSPPSPTINALSIFVTRHSLLIATL